MYCNFQTSCYLVITYHAFINSSFFYNIVIDTVLGIFISPNEMETTMDLKLESARFALASPAQELQRILNTRAIDGALSKKGSSSRSPWAAVSASTSSFSSCSSLLLPFLLSCRWLKSTDRDSPMPPCVIKLKKKSLDHKIHLTLPHIAIAVC